MITATISVIELIYTFTSSAGILNVWAWFFFWHRWREVMRLHGDGDLLGIKILAMEKLIRHTLKVMIQLAVFTYGVWNMTLPPINSEQPITSQGVALVAIIFFTQLSLGVIAVVEVAVIQIQQSLPKRSTDKEVASGEETH